MGVAHREMSNDTPSWFLSGSSKLQSGASVFSSPAAEENEPMSYSPKGGSRSYSPKESARERKNSVEELKLMSDAPDWLSSGKTKIERAPPKGGRRSVVGTERQSGSDSRTSTSRDKDSKPMLGKGSKEKESRDSKSRLSRGKKKDAVIEVEEPKRCCACMPFGKRERVILLMILVLGTSTLEFINYSKKHSLNSSVAIVPRKPGSLLRILVFVFFHESLQHLVFNMLSFCVMGFYLLSSGPVVFLGLLVQWIGGGALIFIGGMNWEHVGFDVLSSGMAVYCIVSGLVDRKIVGILLGVACIAGATVILVVIKKDIPGLKWDSLAAGAIVAVLQFIINIITRKVCRRKRSLADEQA
eukprot:c4416_g1_i2.p1 GENE.c4416_g1_i2~~c4416_g1_i2.p1  ORF type:complete len:356 (+),score=73.66 c4416_g1_i2:2-1069(+)